MWERNVVAAVKITNAFEWPGQPLKIALFSWGSALPCNTWFLGPTQVFTQNSILTGLAVFAQLTIECPIN